MVRRCAITACPNYKTPTDTIYCFPTHNPFQYRRWQDYVRVASKLNVDAVNLDNFGICALHFPYDAYKPSKPEPVHYTKITCPKLKEYAVPMFLGEYEKITAHTSAHDGVLNDHRYCQEHAYHSLEYILLKRENDSLKWLVDDKQMTIDKKNSEIKNFKRTNSAFRQTIQNQTLKHPTPDCDSSNEILVKNVKNIFTPCQVRLLSNENVQKIKWSDQDKSRAIAQFAASSRGYEYDRSRLHIPLPSSRSIYRWLQEVPVYPDQMLVPSMKILEEKLKDGTPMMSMCAMAIDEMGMNSDYCYDPNEDKLYGGSKNVTVVTVRGLCMDWKEVIYYTFDSALSAENIKYIIQQLHLINANVVSLTSDMGSKNQALWKELCVGRVEEGVVLNTNFQHPVTGQNVWVFPDLPHLVKLLRNHTIDNSITLEDGVVIDKELFQDLISKQEKMEFKLAHKITHKHVNVRGKERQAVAPAFQLYSHRVAESIKFLYPGNEMKHKQASFIQLVNDFCDLSNTRVKVKKQNPYKSPYGTFQPEQDDLYELAFRTFTNMVVGKRRRKTYAPFQKGLIMYIMSIRGLLQDMKKAPVNAEYIMTAHVNQDFLENAFSRLRGFGSFHQNPNAVEVGRRIKKLILSWNFVDSKRTSVGFEESEEGTPNCVTFVQARGDKPLPEGFNELTFERLMLIDCQIEPVQLARENFGMESSIDEGGKEYVSGYIANQMVEKYPEMSRAGSGEQREAFWISKVSQNLTEPSLYWHAMFKKFDEFFEAVHGYNSVCRNRGVCKSLVDTLQLSFPDIQVDILKFFVGIRTNIRVRHMNKRLEDEAFKRAGLAREQAKQSHADYNDEACNQLSSEGEGVWMLMQNRF